MKRIGLLLCDDQAIFREGLRTLLELQEDIEIVGEAADGEEAVTEAIRLRPDVVLMDLRLPGINGIEATRRIVKQSLPTKIIVLTTFEDESEIFAALRAGAVGYLLKTSRSAKLCEAIRTVWRGESFLQPSVTSKVIAEFARIAPHTRPPPPPLREPLSLREIEILGALATGKSNKEIAAELDLAEGTVRNHLSNVFGKLGVLDRTQAALRGRDLGLV